MTWKKFVLTVMVVWLACLGEHVSQADSGRYMIDTMVRGHRVIGTPLAWNDRKVFLLARDGRLWEFAPEEASEAKQSPNSFQPYSAIQIRGELAAELGPGFEISGIGNCLVAHPIGQRDLWLPRFDEMYRSISQYFAVRGFPAGHFDFPLVAIVWPTRQEFIRYAMREGLNLGPGVLGYYSVATNRIALYDFGGGRANNSDWKQNASTLVHEASHQVAFNTGVNSRWSEPPRWLAEGLGTMFEAKGVYNSQQYPNLSDRVNRERLANFRSVVSTMRGNGIAELVGSDQLFRTDPASAYAKAWALTFYLVETRPSEFAKYLQKTNSRKPFSTYSRAQRLADFTSIFGDNLPLLEAQLLRFTANLQ